MRLLVTAANSSFAHALVAALIPDHSVRMTDTRIAAPALASVETVEGDLRDPQIAAAVVKDIDAILHLEPITLAGPGTDAAMDGAEVELLDRAVRGTSVLMKAAMEARTGHFVLASTLDLFDPLPTHWRVSEMWRPRPEPRLDHLCPWLGELAAREIARSSQMRMACLRFGRIVDDAQAAAMPFDPRWVHVDDAVAAVRRALVFESDKITWRPQWWVFHVPAAGPRSKVRLANSASAAEPFLYQPQHDFRERWPAQGDVTPRDTRPWQEVLAPREPIRSRPIRKVVIFGAGGPLGAETARELASSYLIRQTDIRPIADIAREAKPQMPGAPLPESLPAPHEVRVVDVRDPQQVMAACEGMDAILNCSVFRHDPVESFRVNILGAYNIARAAVAHGIRRLVQTGPISESMPGPGDYRWDYDVHVDAPARPFHHLYWHTKYLGQEACRVFADYYDLEVPVLLFGGLVDPARAGGPNPTFTISWRDAARVMRRALEVTSLPSPYEVMHVLTDVPHARHRNDKTKDLLDWQPRDLLEHYWQE